MKTADIRSVFLEHFQRHDHRIVPSAPLVPLNDSSVMFTVAGMVQFKEALTGRETLPYSRATTCQRCVRAGGKHNDLENVGFTARHHTFFEMLGNFSFGDYFKEEAITWGWEFFHDLLSLQKEKIWITVHPTDKEARELWSKHIGIPSDRIVDLEENFWTMGDTGPCGPCTEIFFDQGESVPGGPPGSADEDGDRFLEIGNLVFPQFDRSSDGTLTPLASPGVDTGMGLERLASVKQGVLSNFEIDVFRPVFQALAAITGIRDIEQTIANPSCRVIADHIRCASFLIADGVLPDREGRGYVLRRIIRRGLRHAHKLGVEQLFFSELVNPLIEEMGEAYPILMESQDRIRSSLEQEESRFKETLSRGLELLSDEFGTLKTNEISGEVAFKLYDTFGFPLDLTVDIAREKSVTVNTERFDELMTEQQQRARDAGQFKLGLDKTYELDSKVNFLGYQELEGQAEVLSIFKREESDTQATESLSAGQEGLVVLNQTAFYGEAGGQVGDVGEIRFGDAVFEVTDVTRSNDQFFHHGCMRQGSLAIGNHVSYAVDRSHRQDVARNHSATHLLHAALRQTLGAHVQQRGSLVEGSRLRFDFSHDLAMTAEELSTVEQLVNEQILGNAAVQTQILGFDDAIETGAIALFGEKYDDEVRVLSMGNRFSIELCGGTHVEQLGEIGLFTIESESSIAAGVRRIEAISGRSAYLKHRSQVELIQNLAKSISTTPAQLEARIAQISQERLDLKSKVSEPELPLGEIASRLLENAFQVGDVEVLTSLIDESNETVLACYDLLKQRWSRHVLVLATCQKDRCQLVCGVEKSLNNKIDTKAILAELGKSVNVRGGGKPFFARAGGTAKRGELEVALTNLNEWIRDRLN